MASVLRTARKEIFHALYRAVECWERELQLTGHVKLSDFFRAYGQTGNLPRKVIRKRPRWAGARPEARAIGYDAHGVAAHIVILHLRHTPAGPDPAL
ncbi:hypothetical protein EN781_19535 [Mesorhizobium sp. M4A.F.Ca.ET.090.04.2.1]|nr:hypothetical protein EN781_19535 [Mesorhizobium sp. M4A.F.Ca.ET.090.04.2.1]